MLVDDQRPSQILGFFTLAACEILVDKLPGKFAKKYPPQAPTAKLARLAVAKEMQKQGLGSHMMFDAIRRIVKVAEHLGIIGFFVDAKDENAAGFYRQFGFIPLPLETIRKALHV